MRKVIIILLLLVIVSGCGILENNRFSSYKHYDLINEDIMVHSYVDNENITRKYAIADITTKSSEAIIYGLFYQVDKNDYILLETLEISGNANDAIKFHGNHLYTINTGTNSGNFEYVLDAEKIKKTKLTFEFSSGFLTRSIQNVTGNEIYYYAYTNDETSGNSINVKLKCSLSTYKCELIK